MKMSGEQRLEAPRERVYRALNDPEVLRRCIPGCENLESQSSTALTATVVAKVGPVKARFAGAVTLSDLTFPESYSISGEGKGGAAGFVRGGAQVHLAADGEATIMSYEVQATIGGKLAQLGARLIDGTARKLADEFFATFGDLIAAQEASAGSTGDTTN